MKTLYFVCFFALLVAAVSAKKCYRASDCGDSECCIHKGVFRAGECKPFAQDGEECSLVEAKLPFSDKYIEYCPCEEGLYCEPEESKEDDSIFKKILKDFRCTAQRRDTVRPTRRPRPTTESPEEE